MTLIKKNLTASIIGAVLEVHSILGNGFLEAVYQDALAIEFEKRKIPYEREKQIQIQYKGITLSKTYIADFVCFDEIIVELKALSSTTKEHDSQILNYLKASNCKIGLLLNFGESSLKPRRFVL
jgi:GxxExxY protein